MPHDHRYHALQIAAVVDETADTRSFVLDVPTSLASTFAYRAGQYCTFRANIDGTEVVRCYSMSSSPDVGDPLTTTVKRVPDGRMSNWMNDTLRAGDTIDVMPPTGLFVLADAHGGADARADRPIVAFAGGSGITPVMSIVKTALATTTRPIRLVYANRDAASVIFAAGIDAVVAAAAPGRLSVHHHLDADRGFLDADACAALVGDRIYADFYVCGPGPFMDTVETGLAQLGVDRARVHSERFVVPEDDVPADSDGAVETEQLVLKLGRGTHTLAYSSGDTVLEAARRGGLNPPYSCESGSCATCMALLEDGTVRMRVNNALTPEEVEEGWILTCQSLPTSKTATINYDA